MFITVFSIVLFMHADILGVPYNFDFFTIVHDDVVSLLIKLIAVVQKISGGHYFAMDCFNVEFE